MPSRGTFQNFGRNVEPGIVEIVVPRDSAAVLDCLDNHRNRRVRAIGSGHSWSDAARTDDIAVDVRQFNTIELKFSRSPGNVCVEAGAGCTVERVLDYLEARGYTLPVYGIVGKQTIAGAISTATHGSGRPSMSHYVESVTVAAYDTDGTPRIFEWSEGDRLLAARCGIGCTGVLLSVVMCVEPDFPLEERSQSFENLDDLLETAREWPRSQFYLVPWSWKWFAQLRRPASHDRTKAGALWALFLRGFRLAAVDMCLNGAIRALTNMPGHSLVIPWLFRWVFPLIAVSGMRVTDSSRKLLTMRHDLYRHVECELFVPARHVKSAASFVEWVLRTCGGEQLPAPTDAECYEYGSNVLTAIQPYRGTYVHDYLVTFRRVLRDDTLISMTSGDDDQWYSISLITYQRELTPFVQVMRFLAKTMARAYGARPHWGKLCPLTADDIERLYPELERFRRVCGSVDPSQVFVNDFAHDVLGFCRQGQTLNAG